MAPFRSLRIDLASPRRTAERVLLEVLDPSGDCLGSTTFCVDWQGENPMRLWLDNMEPRGPRARWAAVGGMRLSRRKPGMWPTELMACAVACSADAPRWDVNESDTVIELGWHEQGVQPSEWRVVPDATAVPTGTVFYRAPQPGTDHRPARELPRGRPAELANGGPTPWLGFGFLQADEPGRLTLERRFDLPVGGYREIMAKLLWDRDADLEVTALVDGGREVTVAGGERGREGFGQWITFGADLAGARILRSVRVAVAERPDRRVEGREIGANLFWILLRRPSALDDMPVQTVTVRLQHTEIWPLDPGATARREVRSVPFAEPPESTTPVGDPLSDGMPFGFLIRRDELAALRRRALGPLAPIFNEIRAEADRGIATELTDRNYYGTLFGGGIGHPKGLRGAGMRVYAPVVAATHLITGEAKYAVAARRWILRAAHSDDWRAEHGGCLDRPQAGERLPYWDSFIGWHPRGFAGSLNHPFWIADAAHGIVVAYDMLYHCFSPDERRTVEDCFARLGIYLLADKLREQHAFYSRMNQGVLFAMPLLMQTAFLVRRDPRYEELYRFALEFVEEFGRTPWNADGVCGEGPGYGVGTVGLYVEALSVLAACRGREIAEVIPEPLPRVLGYLTHMRSTWDAPGLDGRPHFLGISDGSEAEWIGPDVLAFFAGRLRDPVARYFWDERFAADTPPASLPALLHLQEGPSDAPELPPAAVYRDQPMAFLRTGWRTGDSLVMLNNIREITGHGHRDRLSVIFEYGGEQLLLDPGMIGYADPSGALYKGSACHNTITFGGRDQRGGLVAYDTAITDVLSTSGDRCPGDPAGVDWVTADATAVYEGARRVRRHVVFLRPCVVLLLDDVETERPEAVWLNFTLLGPLRMEGSRAVSETGRNRLDLATVADHALSTETSLWGTHWSTVPSYRLERRLPAARRAVLVTALAAAPVEGPPPAVETASGSGWIGTRVAWVDGEGVPHEELCLRRTTDGEDDAGRRCLRRRYRRGGRRRAQDGGPRARRDGAGRISPFGRRAGHRPACRAPRHRPAGRHRSVLMRYRKLGRTGLECSEIGLGAAQIGIRSVPESTAERVLRTALEVGINFIDTAAMYGASEARIGRYLPRDADVIVATKCGDYEVMEDGTPRIVVDYSPGCILRIVDESRRRLGRDVLDIVLFHGLPRGEYDADAAFETLLEAKSRGWARFVGVSGDGPAAAEEARRRPLDVQELTYSILYQEAGRDLLPALRERGMGVIVKRPVANAAYLSAERPATGFGESWDHARTLGLRELAGEIPLLEFALRFTLSRADVSTAIVGTTDPRHLQANALISDGRPLPADTLARISEAYEARLRR